MARQLPTGAPGKTGPNENIVSPVDTSWMDSIFEADWFKGLEHDVQENFRDFLVKWAEQSANTQMRERESVIDAQKAKTEAVRATTDTMKNSFIRDSVLKDRQRRGYRTLQQRINEATDPETRKYYQDIQKEAAKFGFVYSHKWQKQRNLPKFVWVLVKVAQSHGLQLLKLAVSCLKLVELEKQMLVKHFA